MLACANQSCRPIEAAEGGRRRCQRVANGVSPRIYGTLCNSAWQRRRQDDHRAAWEFFPFRATGMPGIAACPQRRRSALPLPIQPSGRTHSVESCNQGLERATKPQLIIASSILVSRGFDERRDSVVVQMRHDVGVSVETRPTCHPEEPQAVLSEAKDGSLQFLGFTTCDKLQGSFAALRMTGWASFHTNSSAVLSQCPRPARRDGGQPTTVKGVATQKRLKVSCLGLESFYDFSCAYRTNESGHPIE